MDLGILVPVAAFAGVILIVAFVRLLKVHDVEVAVHWKLHQLETEHREAMQQLDQALKSLRGRRD